MQINGTTRHGFLLSTAFLVAFGSFGMQARAQAVPGTVVPPGTQQNHNSNGNCTGLDGSTLGASSSDTGCAQTGPGFATPSTNTPVDEPKPVTAIVRVQAVVERPATVRFPMSFDVIGSTTMVKAKMPRLNACFAAGQILSNRSGAATSTTCLDHKGEVMAYQECMPKTGDTAMACSTMLPSKEVGSTVASAKP